MNLKSHWTKHLSSIDDPEDRAKAEREVEALFNNSDKFRELLYNIIDYRCSEKTQRLDKDSPGWPYKRAAQDGYEEAIEDIKALLMVDTKL